MHAVHQPLCVCVCVCARTSLRACVCALHDMTEGLVAAVAVVTVAALLVLLLLLSFSCRSYADVAAHVEVVCWCLCGDFNTLS